MKNFLHHFLAWGLLFVFTFVPALNVQADTTASEDAVASLLNRIGGAGTSDRFAIAIDESLATGGNDVFVIGSSR